MQDQEPAAPGIREGLRLLRTPSFARLFGSRLISTFGSAMAPVAMAFAVLDLTGSAASMGLVIASQTGAQVAVQLFGGAFADRGSRQRMMVLADLLSMSAQAGMAALLFTGTADVQTLCLLMAVNGVALALHWPAAVGLVPQVVPPDRLQPANGLLSLAQSGAMGLGAACAGLLVATLGGAWAIAIDAGTFAVSAALVAGLYAREQQRTVPASLFQDLRDGWTEFTSHRWLWAIVLQFTVMLAAWQGSMAVVGPTVAKRLLGGPTDWGWIAGALGAGLLAGGVLALRVRVERPMLVATLCVFLNAVPVLLLSLPAPVPVIAAGAFLAGMGSQIFGVLWYTALHTHVAPEALSRVSAYDILGSIALVPLGEAVAGPVLEAIGTGPTLWAAACLIVLPTALVLLVPEVRTLRSRGVLPPASGGC